MSTAPKLDMASATLRHVHDAARLCEGAAPSFDQAWHLAGFGPECARKAALGDALHRLIGHKIHDDALLDWSLAVDRRAARLVRRAAPVGDWQPEHRYERTGSRRKESVVSFVAACEADTVAIVGTLWSAGVWAGEAPE